MDDWERGMTMKKFDCSIGKKLAVPLLCFAFLLPAGECALGAEPPKWTENKADVRIYQTELSDFYEISFLNLDSNCEESTYERDVKNGIRLLMINGGFVPEPETVLQDGVVYAPLEKIAEPLGITYNLTDESGNYLTLRKGDTTLVFPRYNESTVLHLITCVITIICMFHCALLRRHLVERYSMWMTTRKLIVMKIIRNPPIG